MERKSNPFFIPLILALLGGAIYGIANTKHRAPIPWHKTGSEYICPKCGSKDINQSFHQHWQVCACLGRPCDIDHLSLECRRCGYESYDPK